MRTTRMRSLITVSRTTTLIRNRTTINVTIVNGTRIRTLLRRITLRALRVHKTTISISIGAVEHNVSRTRINTRHIRRQLNRQKHQTINTISTSLSTLRQGIHTNSRQNGMTITTLRMIRHNTSIITHNRQRLTLTVSMILSRLRCILIRLGAITVSRLGTIVTGQIIAHTSRSTTVRTTFRNLVHCAQYKSRIRRVNIHATHSRTARRHHLRRVAQTAHILARSSTHLTLTINTMVPTRGATGLVDILCHRPGIDLATGTINTGMLRTLSLRGENRRVTYPPRGNAQLSTLPRGPCTSTLSQTT